MFQKLPYFKTPLLGIAGLLMGLNAIAQWNQVAGTSAAGASQAFVVDDKMYISGGYVGFTAGYVTETRVFDPSSSFWAKATSPAESNRSGGIGFNINGKGYVGLGQKNFLSFSPSPENLLDLNEYDAATAQWTSKAAFPGAGRTGSTVFVLNNVAYIIGGSLADDEGPTDEVWAYDPATDVWTQKADFPIKVDYASGFSLGTLGYVVGGISAKDAILKATFSYDPELDTWTKKSDLPQINVGGTAFVLEGRAYYGLGSDKALGGSGAKFPTKFYRYDAETDAWSTASFTWPRQGRLWPVSVVVGAKAYIGTGYKFDGGESAYRDLYELDLTPTSTGIDPRMPIVVYPNPACDQLFVKGSELDGLLSLIDNQGKTILETAYTPNSPIDISHLQSGIYHIKVMDNQGSYFGKLSIVH